jgi:hypothetical protein
MYIAPARAHEVCVRSLAWKAAKGKEKTEEQMSDAGG